MQASVFLTCYLMIKITAVSYNNLPLQPSPGALFGHSGGTIGRDEDNTFVLADAKRLVSRKQAEIRADGTHYVIVNLSRATPMLINGVELKCDDARPLKIGDEIRVGLYVLQAESHLAPVDRSLPGQPPEKTDAKQADATEAIPSGAAQAVLAESPSSTPQIASRNAPADDAPAENRAELLQAFLRGAGIANVGFHTELTPEFMETLGKLVASSVHGTFELLASRATMKREVKADLTTIVLRNNNPLKFLSDSETILLQMLRKKMPGFMGPEEAMQDAFQDLQAHQTGMVAGMHAAVGEVLERFDPTALEQRLKERSVLDAVLPAHRKARMWDQYTVLFNDIHREAQHEFDALFGKAFVAAYEREIDRFHDEH
jgi:FHA domain-containing protein